VSEKPNIKWVPSPNHSAAYKKQKTIAIVNHIMSGTLAGTDSWFANPASQVSSHFGVGKNGEIHQYVDLSYPAWANGGVSKPDWLLLQNGVNPNYCTVSIEHEGYSGDVMPEAQYQATLALHRWLIETLGIPVTQDNIIGHYRIDSVNKANCPGSGFPWDRLFQDLKGEEGAMKEAVAYWTLKDFSSAELVAARLGNCGTFCRNANPALHPDAKAAKHLVVIGGPEITDHPNVTNKCGLHAEDTAILAAEYAKTL
jgi:Negative regulator of beta-lactamase expression